MEERQATAVGLFLPDDAEAPLLDAASALIAARGIGGLTIAELAREAGVSRPTIYRRWSGTDEVVRAALRRQAVAILLRLGPRAGTRGEIVDAVLRFSDLFRDDPVFGRLLDREPEVFTRYSLERIGSSQRVILQWIGEAIVRGQEHGSVRAGDPSDMAVMLLLIAQSAILSHHAVSPLIGDEAWRFELTRALDGHLRP